MTNQSPSTPPFTAEQLAEFSNFVQHHKANGLDIGYQVDLVRAYDPKTYQTVAELKTPIACVAASLLLQGRTTT